MSKKNKVEVIGPQPGKQEQFLESRADITIFGGAAGGGKSHGILLLPLYYRNVERFNCIIFRRTFPEITRPGGLWDEANHLYSKMGATLKGKPEWAAIWPSGAKVVFSHLEYEKDCESHHGGQYCLICFDEITTFSEFQFIYLLMRNRSTCGVKPYVRCTCNPDADSWVKKWIAWWLDEDTGLPIEDRAGKLRWFIRGNNNTLIWNDADGKPLQEKTIHTDYPEVEPKSMTFIPSRLEDNAILMKLDPNYKSNLLAMNKVDRERFYYGNWNARAEDGMFSPDWFELSEELPKPTSAKMRYWDRANTEKSEKNTNPDYTSGIRGYISGDVFVIDDLQHFRGSPAQNEKRIEQTAKTDGKDVIITLEQEPASSGKDVIYHYQERVLKDYVVRADRPSGQKTDRAKAVSALAEQGKVILKVDTSWNRPFLNEMAAFPPNSESGHDDIVMSVCGLYKCLTQDFRIIPAYSSKNQYDKDLMPEGINYACFYQEKNLYIYGCFMRWDYREKHLYVHDELFLQNFTIPQLGRIIKQKSPGGIGHCNDFMNRDGDSTARMLYSEGCRLTESSRFNDEGALPVANHMFKIKQISVHKRCVEMDRQLRNWMLENNRPQTIRVGMAKCICMAVSDLRDQKKIQPPEEPRPYSSQRSEMFERPPEHINSPYGRKTKHWMM